jgi:hypothetical protein
MADLLCSLAAVCPIVLFKRQIRGGGLRRFISFACTLAAFAGFARAQQIDLTVGGNSLFSSKPTSASLAYLPPAEKGGTYPSFSAQIAFKKHFGFNAEVAARAKQGLYNGYQNYRPILYDVNAVFTPQLRDNVRADLMAGVGGQSTVFYSQFGTCNFSVCPPYVSSTHFLAHAGAGVRYYFWRDFFARPEVHYYRVMNNFEFHSGNVFRAGVSVGYTFGSK